MKINELNMFQNLLKGVTDTVGKTARAVRGNMSGSEDAMAKKMFINKFVSRGMEALDTAVQQKLVNPNITKLSGAGSATQSAASPTTPSAPASGGTTAPAAGSTPTTSPATPAGTTAPAGNTTAPAGGGQKPGANQIDIDMGKIVGQMRKLQSGTKPLPDKMIQGVMKDIPNARYNKDWAISTGNKIKSFADKGYDVKDLHKAWMAQNAIGTKQQTIQESIEESRLQELYHRLTSTEKFRNALKKSGYDPELAISRLGALLAKRKAMADQRDELVDVDDLREVSPQGGGKVAGQLSNSPNAIRKRNARLAARQAATTQQAPTQQQQGGLPPGVDPVKVNNAQAAAGLPPVYKKTANGGWEETDQYKNTRVGNKQAAPQQQKPQQKTAPQQQKPQQAAQQPAQQQAAPAAAPTAAKPGRPSMGQWLKDNFIKNFFRGVPWQSAEPQIDKILMRLPKSYKAGTLQKDLQDIASIGWSLSPKKD